MEKTIVTYPNVYFGIYNALVATCPLDAFPDDVQAYLSDMAERGLLKIDCGYVSRLMQPRQSDFAIQLRRWING